MNPEQQELFDTLPTTGEQTYEAWTTAIKAAGNDKLLRNFHKMRRNGLLGVRLDKSSGSMVMYVSRSAG